MKKRGNVTINSGTFKTTGTGGYSAISNMGAGTITVKDATATGPYGAGNNGSGTLTIEKGTYTGTTYDGVANHGGTVNIKGGTIKGKNHGVYQFAYTGTVNVSGGTITGENHNGIMCQEGTTVATITVSAGNNTGNLSGISNASKSTININGGTITGTTYNGITQSAAGKVYLKAGTVQGKNYSVYSTAGNVYYRATTLKKTSNNTTGTGTISGSWTSW